MGTKAEELQPGMEFQEKEEEKDEKQTKAVYKEPKDKRCLLTLDLKLFRSSVKEKHYASIELQSLAVWGKKLLTQTSLNKW